MSECCSVVLCTKAEQKVRPAEESQKRSESDEIDVVLNSCYRSSQPQRVGAVNEAVHIAEGEAVLGYVTRQPGCNAHRALNLQTRQFIVVTHRSFCDTYV